MSISTSSVDTPLITHSLTLVQQSSYVQITGAAVLLYDYTLTVHDECRLVWRAPWSIGKVLFLFNRYPPFVDAGIGVYRSIAPSIPLTVCTHIYDVSGWMIIAGIIISEIIMVIRVWALWEFSRVVGALLLVMATLGIGVTSISYVKFSDEISCGSTPQSWTSSYVELTFRTPTHPVVDMDAIPSSLNLNGCFPAFGSNIVFLAFVSLFVWETLVMVLLLSKCAQHFRYVSRGFLRTVYQDGVLYYGVMVVVSCINVAILLTWPVEGANLLTPIQRVLHSLISSHMLFQLRETARKRQHFPSSHSPVDIDPGTLVFASRDSEDVAVWFGDGLRSNFDYQADES
ncbi:hypothetical protein EYR38_005138 [Pleurotus pulmonarius]|nr:hypothetical protein EYR38_005138 [Pleurotus pulmonarius]